MISMPVRYEYEIGSLDMGVDAFFVGNDDIIRSLDIGTAPRGSLNWEM